MYRFFILLFFISNAVFSQQDDRELIRNNFRTYIEEENLKEKYADYKKVNSKDERFSIVLKERIKLGFVLGDEKQLQKDIQLISKISLKKQEIFDFFNPHSFPPTEWERFLELTESLNLNKFKDTSSLLFYHNVKGQLALMLLEHETTLKALEEVKTLIGDSMFLTSYLTDHYINALIELDKNDKAIDLLESAFDEFKTEQLLYRLISLYFMEEKYAKIINYANAIYEFKNTNLYYLALSYKAMDEKEKQLIALENYARQFKFNEDTNVYIENKDANYVVPPEHLETIGDTYFEIEPKAACKYYKLAINDNTSTNIFIMEKYKMAISDDEKLQKLKKRLEKEEKEKEVIKQRIAKKLQACD